MGLFHNNLLHDLSVFGVNVHHVDAFGKVGEVEADLLAFGFGAVHGLAVEVDNADVVDARAVKGDFALRGVGLDIDFSLLLHKAYGVLEVGH